MKYIKDISIVLVLLAAFSCKKEPVPSPCTPQKIDFLPEISTKSFISDVHDSSFKEGFAVFASKTERTPSAKTKEIMTNVKVYNTTGLWTYSPEVWWGLNCDHDFLAVYPYSSSQTDYTFGTNDKVCHISSVKTLKGTTSEPYIGSPCGQDIMYARHQEYYDLGITPKPIKLDFKHALTAVSFRFRNVSEKNISSITDISLSGLFTHATDLAIPRDPSMEPTMKLDVPIEGQEPGSEGTYKFPDYNITVPSTDQDWKVLTGPDIILPQTLISKKVPFTFTVNFTNGTKETHSYDIEKVGLQSDISTKFDYLPGKHYIYRIDILDKDIKFSVYVTDWIEDKIIELK